MVFRDPMDAHQNRISESNGPPRQAGWWLLMILLLGFGLRWAELAWGQGYCFNMQNDGTLACSVAVDYANGQTRAQYIGQPNYNFHSKLPGPLWTMFCGAGLRLGGSPEGIMFEILGLNVIAIYLSYLLAKWTLGERAALWTAFLVATFPRVITYSVAVYNPNVMPFLGTIFFLALWRVTQRDNSRAVFWLPLIPLVALQFHMSGLMLIPTAIVTVIITAARLNFMWVAAGLLAAIGLYLPYLGGEMGNHWQNTKGFFAGDSGGLSIEALKVLTASAGFLVSWSPGWIRIDHEYVEFGRACFGSEYVLYAIYAVSTAVAAYLVIGIFLEIKKSWKNFKWPSRKEFFRASGVNFLSLSLMLPLMFALLGGKGFHARYCLVFIAPLFALTAVALIHWLDSPDKRKVFCVLFGFVIATNLWIVIATNLYQKDRIEHGKVFIPSFRKLEMIYQQLKRHAGEGRPITVDDADYMAAMPPKDLFLRDAAIIRRFAEVREKETPRPKGAENTPVVFKLYSLSQVSSNDPAVAFYGNGIALAAVRQ